MKKTEAAGVLLLHTSTDLYIAFLQSVITFRSSKESTLILYAGLHIFPIIAVTAFGCFIETAISTLRVVPGVCQ